MDKNRYIDKLEEEVKIERDEKMDLVQEQEKYRLETKMQQDLWDQETCKLRKEIDNMTEIALTNEKGAEENLKMRIEQEKNLILNEHDTDRQAYQKLLQEYNCLEMHCETLQSQLDTQSRTSTHIRNISDVSTISNVDENFVSTTDLPEDHGYGSVRSTASSDAPSRGKLENIEWNGVTTSNTEISTTEKDFIEPKQDICLVLRLQQKLENAQRVIDRLQNRLNDLEISPKSKRIVNAVEDANRITHLEVAYSKVKKELFELIESVADEKSKAYLSTLVKDLQSEIDRKGEEIIQLKNVLANQTDNIKAIVNCRSKTGEYINEDGELALAYESQKRINKQLELELQDEKSRYKNWEKRYETENEKLERDNEKLLRILSENLPKTDLSESEQFMQLQITKLTNANLDLSDKNEELTETVRKLKKQAKAMSKRIKDNGMDFEDHLKENGAKDDKKDEPFVPYDRVPAIRKKEKDYLGMFTFKNGEENIIMKQLVLGLKPRTAVSLLPGLPAYIVFMCIRHTDYINDEDKVQGLLSSYRNSVRKIIKENGEEFEVMALWLSNTLRLVNTMQQYSGNKTYQQKNTPKQNSQCLRNFDLSEYRQVLSNVSFWINSKIIKFLSEKVQPLVVPAILEHEEIPGISGSKLNCFRGRVTSLRDESPVQLKPTETLLQELTNYYKMLQFYGVDMVVTSQIFKQVFYFMCASSLNNLLLRKELCHWSKGFQIRHNLSHFEMWTREKQLDEQSIQKTLQPIVQAAHLLQARKSLEDVDSVCEMCSALTPLQICKILNLYTPVDDYEQRVPEEFIKQVQERLKERSSLQEQQTLLMDIKFSLPVSFPFNPSTICLEDIEIPEVLKLPMLEKL